MSFNKQSDEKNHLSARHRTEIHLTYPESQADATGFVHEEAPDIEVNDSVGNPLDIPTPIDPETISTVIARSVRA
jgi:hypothetical protein